MPHSPGPWKAYWSEVDSETVCEINMTDDGAVCEVLPHLDPDIWKADARLIAAAPTMFQLLKDIYASAEYGDQGDWRDVAARLRALISEIEGAP